MTTLPVRTKSPIPVHEEVAVVVNKKPGFQHHSTSTVFGAFRGPEFPRAGINLFSIPKEIKSGHVDLSLWCTWWSAAVPNPSFLTFGGFQWRSCTHLCIRLKDLESISETKRYVVYIHNLESPNFAWKLRPKDGQTRSGSTQASVSKSHFWMWIMSWRSTDNGDVSTRWGWVWLPVCVEGSEGHVRPQDASDVMKSLSFYESPHHVKERYDMRIKIMPRNHCLFSMCFAGLNDIRLLCLSFEPYIGRHQACYDDQWYQNHANGVHQAAIKGIKKTSEVDFFETKIEK